MFIELEKLIGVLSDVEGGYQPELGQQKYNGDELWEAPVDINSLFPERLHNSQDQWLKDLPEELIDEIFDHIFSDTAEDLSREDSISEGKSSNQPLIWQTCAWYQPISFFGESWGIYIKEDCVIALAKVLGKQLKDHLRGFTKNQIVADCLRMATCLYFLHEYFHHKVESAAIKMSVVSRRGYYRAYRNNVYNPTLGTDDCLEEAMANADMYIRLSEQRFKKCFSPQMIKSMKDYLKLKRFPIEPPGYRKAVNYLTKMSNKGGRNTLLSNINQSALKIRGASGIWDAAPQTLRGLVDVRSNIYTLVPRGRKSIFSPTLLDFSISGKTVIKKAKSMGWIEVSGGGKGSHTKMKRANARSLTIPHSKHLPTGTLDSIKKSLGLSSIRQLQDI